MVPISPFSTQLQLNFHSIIITLRASISGGLSPFCVRVKKKRLSGSKLELRGVGFTLLLLCFVQRQGVMVPISPFSAQLQLNFLLPYNCCRYEGCTVTCTFFFWLIGFVYSGCGWQLYIHTVYTCSLILRSALFPGFLLQNTNIYSEGSLYDNEATSRSHSPYIMRVLGLHAQPKSRLQNMLGWCFNYSINFTQ